MRSTVRCRINFRIHGEHPRTMIQVDAIRCFYSRKNNEPGTRLTFTEQGAYLDDPEAAANREAGTRALIDALAKEVEG